MQWGILKLGNKYLEKIEGAVVMTEQKIEEFANRRKQRFDWAAFLPGRKAWFQTLILLPFGLPVASFLGASWNLAVNSIEEQQYLAGIGSMAINLVLPSLFLACLCHWGWFIWKQTLVTWYPNRQALWAGVCATLTIAASFATVELFNQRFGVCGDLGWGGIGQSLFCNLNGYGFESKSWFGVWFIIAAYCYQAQALMSYVYRHYSARSRSVGFAGSTVNESTSISTDRGELAPDDFRSNPLDPIVTSSEE
jgi:hypothetical protein